MASTGDMRKQMRLMDPDYAAEYRAQCRETARKYQQEHKHERSARVRDQQLTQAVAQLVASLEPQKREGLDTEKILEHALGTARQAVGSSSQDTIWSVLLSTRKSRTVCAGIMEHSLRQLYGDSVSRDDVMKSTQVGLASMHHACTDLAKLLSGDTSLLEQTKAAPSSSTSASPLDDQDRTEDAVLTVGGEEKRRIRVRGAQVALLVGLLDAVSAAQAQATATVMS
jgi:hypothetical protein